MRPRGEEWSRSASACRGSGFPLALSSVKFMSPEEKGNGLKYPSNQPPLAAS